MCGIAGVLYFHGQAANIEVVKQMTATLAHRGPDGDGHFAEGPIALGHRRLAIIDLSQDGAQPMCNEDGTVWITFNGEIYNYHDLRRQLRQKGHHFRSETDTEVIVHAYEEWGKDCVQHLNGMFAFALWDSTQQSLWLTRDRLGVKPLFYYLCPDGIFFGSEIKSLLGCVPTARPIDYEALTYFLALNYTPAPYTLFSNVRQLLPGHYLVADTHGNTHDKEYWDLGFEEDYFTSERQAISQFVDLLEDSVRLRLVSDVPFGVFLSGGLDSSSVAYWMAQNMKQPIKTFSIGFSEGTFDELDYSRKVAASIGAEAHERIVTADAATILPRIVYHAEEPTADSSMVAAYYLAQMARERVKMVLTGDGADEILAGYDTYQAHYVHRLLRMVPRWMIKRLIQPIINNLPVSDSKGSLDFRLKRFVGAAELSSDQAHASWRLIFGREARASLLSPIRDDPCASADAMDLFQDQFDRAKTENSLNRMLYVDTRFYLPNDMLVKVDRMTMAHGLEAREPFLDYRLVELAAKLPPALKLRYFLHGKYILKASMAKKLPASVIWRRKQGFNVPNARWIKHNLKPFVSDVLSPARLRRMGMIDVNFVQALLTQHFSNRVDYSHQIWSLLSLSLWWDAFVAR